MSTLNPSIGRLTRRRQAASLAQVASWYLLRVWSVLERQGQRRAAAALARLGADHQQTEPEFAAQLLAQARAWRR